MHQRLAIAALLALLPALAAPFCVSAQGTAPATGLPADLEEAVAQFQALAAPGTASESARLARFFELYWHARILLNPDLARWTGYPGAGDRWPDLSPEAFERAYRLTREQRATLASIDRARLTPSEQLSYDLARRRLERQVEGERFQGGQYLLIGPMGGIDLTLAGEGPLPPHATVEAYEAGLRRLAGFPHAVEQTLALLRRGLELGITPPRVTLEGVPQRVASLITDDPWQSPVLATFTTLPKHLAPGEQERLHQAAADLFVGQVAPALRRLQAFLAETYVPGAHEAIAMTALPDGAAWYAFTLRSSTSTELSPPEIYQLGLSEVARIRAAMEKVRAASGFEGNLAEFSHFLRTDRRFFYQRPEDLVAGYRDITKRIDPELVKLFGRLPRLPYGVTAMDGEAAKSAPAAYFNSGSLAAGTPGWFLVNTTFLESRPKWGMEALALHEAVPGHHLQYALVEELGELPQWRKWDVYPAFSEGWGLYAESLGSDLGLYRDPYSKFGQLSNEIWRALRLVVDPGIHARGWSRQQAIDYYFLHSAKPLHEIEREVDRIIAQPGTVPVYKIGELKIRELRALAERELGARFDLRAFHDRLLGRGQLPLDLLEQSIKEWVAEQKAASAAAARLR